MIKIKRFVRAPEYEHSDNDNDDDDFYSDSDDASMSDNNNNKKRKFKSRYPIICYKENDFKTFPPIQQLRQMSNDQLRSLNGFNIRFKEYC